MRSGFRQKKAGSREVAADRAAPKPGRAWGIAAGRTPRRMPERIRGGAPLPFEVLLLFCTLEAHV
jgi:hypothetical protein